MTSEIVADGLRDLTATLAARSLEKPGFITSYHFQRHCVIPFRKKLNVQVI